MWLVGHYHWKDPCVCYVIFNQQLQTLRIHANTLLSAYISPITKVVERCFLCVFWFAQLGCSLCPWVYLRLLWPFAQPRAGKLKLDCMANGNSCWKRHQATTCMYITFECIYIYQNVFDLIITYLRCIYMCVCVCVCFNRYSVSSKQMLFFEIL